MWKTLKEISGVASLVKLQKTLAVSLAVLCHCDLSSVIKVSITALEPWAHAACLTFSGMISDPYYPESDQVNDPYYLGPVQVDGT